MGRQPRWRRVGYVPGITFFKPTGISMADLEETRVSVEEAEALRLKDLEGMDQDTCAGEMKVSRSTFARILSQARKKLADALLNGKAIRIEGGNYELTQRSYCCGNGHEWDVPFEALIKEHPVLCPTCNTAEIMSLWPLGVRQRGGKRPQGVGNMPERLRHGGPG
jgi:predicted DNA-binding protein (UPF0251 family)